MKLGYDKAQWATTQASMGVDSFSKSGVGWALWGCLGLANYSVRGWGCVVPTPVGLGQHFRRQTSAEKEKKTEQLKSLSTINTDLAMFSFKNSDDQETYYDVLSVKEGSSHTEIRAAYRAALLNYHPDKLQSPDPASGGESSLGDPFLKVQKAWEVLGDPGSRSVYDSQLRALRQQVGVVEEDVSLEDMTVEDKGELLELSYQCRCGDWYSVDSMELGSMGYALLLEGNKISFTEKPGAALPASVVIPCGSCSLQIRLLID